MKRFLIVLFVFTALNSFAQIDQTIEKLYRPLIHFSPAANWINDPNGMVYYDNVYHLFYQYHPYSSVWGPMHWGHATSSDLIHWKEQPIALYPDSIGTIFSGSAVLDLHNTSGFGKDGKPPLVAIFTQHNHKLEQSSNQFQTQSLAYSNDSGKTWTKYSGNPVLKNPGITDFRDPKVMWFEPGKKWIMTLATKNYITFYSSLDLKTWNKESEFGREVGAHGGVWECPDLISFEQKGKKVWALIVNLNPGGPNGGSATQYFIGDFDGHAFKSSQKDTKWLDYGPDEYAGVTWSNTGNRHLFIGWMSNWNYANELPTKNWRNAMTIPRTLRLQDEKNELYIASAPAEEFTKIEEKVYHIGRSKVEKVLTFSDDKFKLNIPARVNIEFDDVKDFELVFSNTKEEQIIVGFDKKLNSYFIDRSRSGKTEFHPGFGSRHYAPRISGKSKISICMVFDKGSVELFADNGLSVMTSIFFPNEPFAKFKLIASDGIILKKMEYFHLKTKQD